MATIWARRRLIRDGAELKNEPNCRMLQIPQGLGGSHHSTTGPRNVKMFSRPAGVETAAKIATHPSSDGRLAVDLLSPVARQRSKSSPKLARVFPDPRFKQPEASHRPVILREGGVSSTPQLLGSITDASEYWVARFRGRRRPKSFAPSLR
jgi:hypothetical protein